MRTETGVPVRPPCTSRRPLQHRCNPGQDRPDHPSQNGRHNPPNAQIGTAIGHGFGEVKDRSCAVQLTSLLRLSIHWRKRVIAATSGADADPVEIRSIRLCLRLRLALYASIANHQ